MPRQMWNEAVVWATASGVAVASTATEAIVFPDVTIFANYMQDGRALRYRAIGQYSTTSTPTLIFGLRWNAPAGSPASGVLLCKTAALTTPSSISAAMWDVDILIQTRSNGSSGTIMANGVCRLYTTLAATLTATTQAGGGVITPMTLGGATGAPGVATCDLTIDRALQLSVTWGTSSASNTLTGLNQLVESLN